MHLESRDVKAARKKHWCDGCNDPIEIGDSYFRYTYTDCGSVHHARQCEVCTAFAKAYPDIVSYASEYYLMFTDDEFGDVYDEFAAEFAIDKLCMEEL